MIKRLLLNRQTQVRFIKFFTVGGTGYFVSILSFNLFKHFLVPNSAFNAAFFVSTTTHYSLNRFWALRSTRSDTLKQLLEYLATVALSYTISFTCFKLFRSGLGLSLGLSQAFSIPPSTVVTFFILNFWVFKHHDRSTESRDEEKKLPQS
jgi:putative flippase GtrA